MRSPLTRLEFASLILAASPTRGEGKKHHTKSSVLNVTGGRAVARAIFCVWLDIQPVAIIHGR